MAWNRGYHGSDEMNLMFIIAQISMSAALEKRLKEFQKKAGNRNCFVCNQKVISAKGALS